MLHWELVLGLNAFLALLKSYWLSFCWPILAALCLYYVSQYFSVYLKWTWEFHYLGGREHFGR